MDDGWFTRACRYTAIALALHCTVNDGPLVPTLAEVERVTVDGADATYRVLALLHRVPGELAPELLLLDTPIYAGFNIADPAYVSEEAGVPVVSVHHYPPDREAVRRALEKGFPGEQWRLRVLEREWERLKRVTCPRGTLYIAVYGADPDTVAETVCRLQLFTRTPEPLYTAGTVATAVSRAVLCGGAAAKA